MAVSLLLKNTEAATFQYSQEKQENTMLESLFNSEYCEIFKSTYFEEHLRIATSENVFMKLRKITDYP